MNKGPGPTAQLRVATVRERIWLLALYGYLASPIVIQLLIEGWRDLLDSVFLFNLVATFLWIAVAHFSVRRPLYLHLVLLPLYVTTSVDLFLLITFGARLTSGYVTIALGNRDDTADFLSSFFRPILIVAIVFPIIYINGLYFIGNVRLKRAPKYAGLALASLGAAYLLLIRHFFLWPTEPIELVVLDVAAHETSAPLGAVFQTALALKVHADNIENIAHRSGFSFGATSSRPADEEIYVWVVGESSRPENWSLFGYGRDTSPKLRVMPGIIPFPDMMTTAPETLIAVPSMLSLRPITDWASVQGQRSVVSAFREAGFKTYWLSTQDVDGWSGIVPQVASEAGAVRYFSQSFDGAVLAEFRKLLDVEPRGSSKLFFVVHTKGSHFDYKHRYPAEFSHFRSPQSTRRNTLIDAYDNSVLYTDWFLSELISTLSERHSNAVLLYSSDHGENLLDDERQLLGHTRGTQHDLSASAFIWISDSMRGVYSDLVSNAVRNAGLPLSLSNLPHSMLELAGIRAPAFDPKMSIFNPGFTPQPRFYMQGGEVKSERQKDGVPKQ